jgi:protein-S-isoprenylcysteine O-methyltransferase Ste14
MYAGEAVVLARLGTLLGPCRRLGGLVIVCAVGTPIVRRQERRRLERFGDEYRALPGGSGALGGPDGNVRRDA